MKSTRWISVCAAGALVLGACGSDGNSSADTTTSKSEAGAVTSAGDETASSESVDSSAATVGTPPDTDTTGVDDTSADSSAATDSSGTGDTSDTSDTSDTTGQTAADPPESIPIDDVPVCQAFTRIALTRGLVSRLGYAADATIAPERIEVVTYSGLVDDLATLRSDMPAELAAGLDPFLARIDAADDAMVAAGFSTDEIAAIGADWNDGLDEIAKGNAADAADPTTSLDQTRLDAAEAAFRAAVGTLADFTFNEDTSDTDELGQAWLAETCPLLSKSTNGG